MARRFDCPYSEGHWIELPDEWLGKHALEREKADKANQDNGLTGELAEFSICLVLSENFRLPGLEGKPENWDFGQMPLAVIAWVTALVSVGFNKAYAVPKALARSSLTGRALKPTMTKTADTGQTNETSITDTPES